MNLPMAPLLLGGFAVVFLLAAVNDLRFRKIPNLLTFPAMLIALVYHAVSNGWAGLWFGLAGLGLGMGVMLVPYAMGWMGAGDAKLMGAAGAVLGWKGAVSVLFLTAVAGALYAVVLFVVNYRWSREYLVRVWKMFRQFLYTGRVVLIPPSEREVALGKPKLCYGVAIAAGTLWTMGSLVLNGGLPIPL